MSAPGILRSARPDPLLGETELPFADVFHPLGFRLDLASNSRGVLEAASEAWGLYAAEFACEPVRLRVIVQPEGGLAPEPCFRAQGTLFAVVSDRDNFGTFDSGAFSGFCVVSAATAAHHAWFRWSFLESIVYMLLTQRYVVPIHAACIARGERGVLLCGPSGAGKSTLAYACARTGWTYVCDDATLLLAGAADRMAIGRPHQVRFREDAPKLFPELAGRAVKLRPNGRLAMEVPMSALPEIRTASRCRIEQIVFLDRRAGAQAEARPVGGTAAVESLLADMPSYGPEVNALHESTLRQLERVPAWRMRYEGLEEGIALLSDLEPA